MNSTIDSRFFKLIHDAIDKSTKYEGYVTAYPRSTMVLFSAKTHTPLAGLILSTPDRGVLSLLTARAPLFPTSPEKYFQGIMNMPDQVIDLSIVNLSNLGHINFNVLHTPHRVNEVDPGPAYGINQVNELGPNQGYTIPVDQRTGRQMVLRGLTTQTATGQEEKVTVDVAESQPQAPKGLYFHLSVVASNQSPALVAQFAEGTVWQCVDHFVRPVEAPRSLGNSRGGQFVPLFSSGPEQVFPAGLETVQYAEDNSLEEEMLYSASRDMVGSVSAAATLPTRGRLEWEMSGLESGRAKSKSRKSSNSRGPSYATVNVGQTQAGQLGYGESVSVHSGFTGLEYAYEHPSEAAVLCLSLCPTLTFYPLPDVRALVKEEVADWIKNGQARILESLPRIFISETCVLDLTSPADTVVCQCGHQCVNAESIKEHTLTTCPLCRGPIAALIQVQALAE